MMTMIMKSMFRFRFRLALDVIGPVCFSALNSRRLSACTQTPWVLPRAGAHVSNTPC